MDMKLEEIEGGLCYIGRMVDTDGNLVPEEVTVIYTDDRILVMDVSNHDAPVMIGKLIEGDGGAELNDSDGVFIDGTHAYVKSHVLTDEKG